MPTPTNPLLGKTSPTKTVSLQDGTQVDPGVVKVMKAIKQVETGGHKDPWNAVGDLDRGVSRGAYQFNKDNYANWAKQYGVDPNDFSPTAQNKVAYSRIKEMKDQGLQPEEIAARWNGAHVDQATGKYAYNNPDYGTKFREALGQTQALQGSSAPTSPTPQTRVASVSGYGGYKPSEASVPTAQADTGTEAPKSFGQKALDVAGKVGDFLFPIAGDIKNVIEGDNTKTGLQIAGDLGMSVLPFVPGLGQAGILAKGAKAASLAGKVGEAAQAAKGAGLLSRTLGNPIASGALAGYGTGVSQNLSQGQSVGDAISPGINTLLGAGLGGGAGLLSKGAGGILSKAAGIPENTKPILSNLSNPKLYDEYINAAKSRAVDVRNPSPLEVAADYTENAVQEIKKNLGKVGQEINGLKETQGKATLKPVTPVMRSFAEDIENKFGLKVYIKPRGQIEIEKAPGRMKNILSSKDEGRLKDALKQLVKLNKGGTLRQASDVLDNLDALVDYSKRDVFGNSNDPLESFLKVVRHNLNGVVGETSPALAGVKTRAHELNRALETIEGAGGNNLQRAELLLKRVFSGDQSAKSREVFDIIKKETGIDLTEHAVLAKHAIDAVGDPSQLSLLSQIMQNAAKEGSPTIPSLMIGAGKGLLNSTIANPERAGRNIVQGKAGLPGLLKKGYLEAGAINLPRFLPTQEPQ